MALGNYIKNKVVDQGRGQAFSWASPLFVGLIIATRGKSNGIRSAAVALGDTVLPAAPNGHLYRCTTAGNTGAGEPTWPVTAGTTVADGTAVWTEMTPDINAFNVNVTEPVGVGSYARVSVAGTLANWAGTQAAGSTTASTGTSGTTSNNNAITFPTPTADWGWVFAVFRIDASSGLTNFYDWLALTTPIFVSNGANAPSFAAATLQFTWA